MMQLAKLEVFGFRGIKSVAARLDGHTVLIGPNGTGKSTIVDAICLALGRERMVRALSEFDFAGADPRESDRFRFVATLRFQDNDVARYSHWFHDGAGVPKWLRRSDGEVLPEEQDGTSLCVQIGYAARFDRETLEVETRRYFHDDVDQADPFLDEYSIGVPGRLLGEIGLFVAPALRTRERILSFASDTFRRLIAGSYGIPAAELLLERDRLRKPTPPIESTGELKNIVERINGDLYALLGKEVKFQLRANGTSSEALLQSLVSHYEIEAGLSLPVGSHGTGLLSLQTILLLFELCRLRREGGKSVILIVEEPELHLPPGLQSRIVKSAMTSSDQAIFTTHSPRVAAIPPPESVVLLSRESRAELRAKRLLDNPLKKDATNAIRRLFADHRQQLTEALMYRFVLAPEGRSDYGWLRLLSDAVELGDSDADTGFLFGALVGVVPTCNGAVVETFERLANARSGVAVLVDGDSAGDTYVKNLLKLSPSPLAVLQWPTGCAIEEVVYSIIAPDWTAISSDIGDEIDGVTTAEDLRDRLKLKSPNGLKDNYLAHEVIASAIRRSKDARSRAAAVLDAILAQLEAAPPSGASNVTRIQVA